ncbi:hypothetical protein LR48_Vigan04g030800 [Vigna angularis]|uniref:Mono-/di-acylglycerol lipase N-terminal domain-containing protein n=1 Tax=Phaseolus angularis TaxID=3914 RepID=A0A0L9UB17_PHAAN|nr:hypothetical protein LR48_Vigan04g030800 [Vigna angularis]
MSASCGVVECIFVLGCARWLWKRCTYVGNYDNATWSAATADEFDPVRLGNLGAWKQRLTLTVDQKDLLLCRGDPLSHPSPLLEAFSATSRGCKHIHNHTTPKGISQPLPCLSTLLPLSSFSFSPLHIPSVRASRTIIVVLGVGKVDDVDRFEKTVILLNGENEVADRVMTNSSGGEV